MSLRAQPLPPVPESVARAAFRRGNPYVILRDRLGPVFADADFAALYPRRGQPAYAPWRLALVTLMQFREGLSDRQAADAARGRIDWKHLLALDPDDAGFDFSVLCEFRARLLEHAAAGRLLDRLLDAAREEGLLRARGRSRTDSTHVLAAIRLLSRLELVAETLRAALNAIAGVAPGWLRAVAPPEWHECGDRRVEDMRMPRTEPKREAYTLQVGGDGFRLLDALDDAGAPAELRDLPVIGVMRRVWARHFERDAPRSGDGATVTKGGDRGAGHVRLRDVQGRGPGDRIESPYDTEARFRSKVGTGWTGYMVHLTETCDAGAPRLVVHSEAVPANMHEALRDLCHPRRPGGQRARPRRAPGRQRLCQRRPHRRRARAPRHRPRGARTPQSELAGARRGCFPRRRLRGGLGEPARALPGGPRQRRLGRVHREGIRQALREGRVPALGLSALPLALALHPWPKPAAPPPAARRARGGRTGQGAARDRGRTTPPRPAPRRRRHDLAGRAQLRAAPGATAARPRRPCRAWSQPPPWTSTALPRGSPDAPSSPNARRASPPSPHSQGLRQQGPSDRRTGPRWRASRFRPPNLDWRSVDAAGAGGQPTPPHFP